MTIAAAPWPLPPALAAAVADLPVDDAGGALRLDGTAYAEPDVALALRLPGAGAGGEAAPPPTWSPATDRIDRRGGRRGARLGRRGRRPARSGGPADYLVRENPWLERRGSWRRRNDGWEVDPARDRDDFVGRARWFAALRPIAGSWVTLLAPPGDGADAGHRRLAVDLDRAAAAMAERVPLPATARERPILVAVETDFTAQARHTGRIGEAVPGGPADLHLVFDRADLSAYRRALAAVLIGRAPELAGLGPASPPAPPSGSPGRRTPTARAGTDGRGAPGCRSSPPSTPFPPPTS